MWIQHSSARLQLARERERELAEDRRRMEERLQAERDKRANSNGGRQPSFEALDHYNQTVQRAWGDVKEQNHAQLAFWQQEVERLRATEAAQLEEIRSLRERLMRAETEAANTSRQIETAGMREMRERFDERHNDMREAHARSIAELKERYQTFGASDEMMTRAIFIDSLILEETDSSGSFPNTARRLRHLL